MPHRRRRRGAFVEINSGKFEIIRALNFGEDLLCGSGVRLHFSDPDLNFWEKPDPDSV